MEIFLTVLFYMYIVAIVIRVFNISTQEYPMTEHRTLGQEMIHLLINIGFFVWVIALKFWDKV